MNRVTIRRCHKEDEPAARQLVASILHSEFPKEVENFPADDLVDIHSSYGKAGEAFFVAVENGSVIGTVGIKREDERTALLRRLFVNSSFRRKKIGTKLIEHAIEFCREEAYQELIFKTTSNMQHAIRLCEKKGFVSKARLPIGPIQLLKFALALKYETVAK